MDTIFGIPLRIFAVGCFSKCELYYEFDTLFIIVYKGDDAMSENTFKLLVILSIAEVPNPAPGDRLILQSLVPFLELLNLLNQTSQEAVSVRGECCDIRVGMNPCRMMDLTE